MSPSTEARQSIDLYLEALQFILLLRAEDFQAACLLVTSGLSRHPPQTELSLFNPSTREMSQVSLFSLMSCLTCPLEESPLGDLSDPLFEHSVADSVNTLLLQSLGQPYQSNLETYLRLFVRLQGLAQEKRLRSVCLKSLLS